MSEGSAFPQIKITTEDGQVFVSDDAGKSWHRPVDWATQQLHTTQCCDPVIDSQIGAANERIAALEAENAALREVLNRLAGDVACGGPMTEDEEGNPFSLETARLLRLAHESTCVRCVVRAALAKLEGK